MDTDVSIIIRELWQINHKSGTLHYPCIEEYMIELHQLTEKYSEIMEIPTKFEAL